MFYVLSKSSIATAYRGSFQTVALLLFQNKCVVLLLELKQKVSQELQFK